MKRLLTVIAVIIIVMVGCEKQAKQSSASDSEQVMSVANKGGKHQAQLITNSLPGVPITATASGAVISWAGLPDTTHNLQIAICDNTSFSDSTYATANLFLQNPVQSTVYPTSFTIPSDWFTGTKFVRIQGDYYVGSQKGGIGSNVLTVTLP